MMTAPSRTFTLIETLAFCTYVGLYIWWLQADYRYSWFVFPIWLIASIILHRDTPKTLGWRGDNLWPAFKLTSVVVLPQIAGLVVLGMILGAPYHPLGHLLEQKHFFGYVTFCFVQQIALNSYATNRLLSALQSSWKACGTAGLIFAALHWPNPVLVPLTWAGGTIMSWLFARERNILPLALGQGILGTLVWWAFPAAWHHAMRVGPGYYNFHLH